MIVKVKFSESSDSVPPLCCCSRLRPHSVQIFRAGRCFRQGCKEGWGFNILEISRFSEMPFPLPPLSEQQRIVTEVERRMALENEAEQSLRSALSRIEQQVSAILEAASFGGLLRQRDPEGTLNLSSIDQDPQVQEPFRSNEDWSSKKLPPRWRWVDGRRRRRSKARATKVA